MYDGYLEMGGNEVLNRQRAYVYTHEGDCPIGWLQCGDCPGLDEALGDDPYSEGITGAPWYDENDPVTGRFYGAYPITMQGLSDSTRTATITEGILDGGTIQGGRRAVRQVRCTALLIAQGMDALEAGMSWLDAALDQEACSTHAGTCGEVDACFFVSCPPEKLPEQSLEEYETIVTDLRRQLHGTVTISGPIVTRELQRNEWFGYIVEFTIASATPFVYSMPSNISPADWNDSGVFQDSPFNLVKYPSAELAEAANLTVATNYSTNPSVEVNTTDWAFTGAAVAPGVTNPTPYLVGSRVTDFHPVGTASYRVQLLGTTAAPVVSGQTAQIELYQQISLAAIPATGRPSFSIYGAGAWSGLATAVTSITAVAQWRTGTTVLSETIIGSTTDPTEIAGRAFALASVPRVAGADNVRVILRYAITWTSGNATPANNSNIRVFADALAVTIP